MDAVSDEERMAVHRALLTVAIDAIERVDDSFGELGELFREHEREYLTLLGPRADAPGMMRDLLELVIWEDYGLFNQVHAFLRALPERCADVAVRVLASIIAELRGAGLDYQLGKACALRQTLVSAADLPS